MITHRPSQARGHVEHGWLNTYHTFSFAHYYDPDWMGFGPLRVINEDRIEAHQGFGEHFHSDMEILTYVIEGSLEHKDSLGNGSVIHPNEIQYMSAGTGIMHSEFNPGDQPVHLLQIWIEPRVAHVAPQYAEKQLQPKGSSLLELIASGDGRDASVHIRQDADVYRSILSAGVSVTHYTNDERAVWLQLITGTLQVNNLTLRAGDGCSITHEQELLLRADTDCHFLLFDMATQRT